ncbi:MAG: DUF87 domain-containing protein [Anaerolineae bacterium]|nr:DUF87 domain-containing protein [Anaerolineae bacterium]
MPFIEAPTTFYLGRRYDPARHRLADEVVYYDSRDLTTHAMVVGMTGSGKTGLCISLLEEAILDNIPAIVIDPKGDITNLLLTFPELQPEDFRPWVNVDDARRAGLDVPSFAADTASRWREGLANWGIVPDRLKWLKLAAQYSIYTPGSDTGLPISIMASLRAPRDGWAGNEEANRERINGTVTALLALIGLNVEPVKDREHVLLANIFEMSWRQGIDLTLEEIIRQVQQPPFDKLGAISIDDFMPEKDRYKLAISLNNIIASPSFQSWIQGESLDIQNLLYQPNGRPRVSIFYIAHLSEPERQFIVTLILENLLGWMRTLSGTTSLRALLYIDEMFGYFPPYPRNPPTKDPILRLLKQARAFGLGLILATQNPGDLDYKGLTNAGTWFIGRLQSQNDQKRVMAGLESLATADNGLNLDAAGRLIADIEPRVFLMHNVHDTGGPVLVHTRWAMSYLRGPLTRQQVAVLMAGQRQTLAQKLAAQVAYHHQGGYTQPLVPPSVPGASPQAGPPPTLPGQTPIVPMPNFGAQAAPPVNFPPQSAPPANLAPAASQVGVPRVNGFSSGQPSLPSSVKQYFVPYRMSGTQALSAWQQRTGFAAQSATGAVLAYRPVLMAQAAVRFQDRKTGTYTAQHYHYRIPDVDKTGLIHWEEYLAEPVDVRELTSEPLANAIYGEPPPGLTDSKRLTALQRELTDVLYNTARLIIPHNPTLKLYGDAQAESGAFFTQSAQAAREQRDAEIDKVTAQFEKAMDRLEERRDKKERELSAEQKELADRKREETFTKGEAFLSILRGRTTYTLSRTSRARRYTRQTEEDLQESVQVIRDLDQEMDDLEQRFEAELKAVNDKWARAANDLQEHVITPFKKDIHVELFGVGWLPHWYADINGQPVLLPAF